jgi:predicted nuclease of restriction endonuclease-like RecB superfamily
LLPRALLSGGDETGASSLHYLGRRDEPWLQALLDEHARYVGRKRVELRERLREPLPVRAPKSKLRAALKVLERAIPDLERSALVPRELRFRAFRAAAQGADREAALARIARELRVTVDEVEGALFADLAGERRLGVVPPDLSPASLALLVNQGLVLGVLKRSTTVRITAWGHARELVRHARALGLICSVACEAGDRERVVLEISGPFSLFRRTGVYGRALASLLPRAAQCHDFRLVARCALGRESATATFVVQANDPIFPTRELAPHDSRLEAAFARDFGRAALDWELVREPRPVEAGGALHFPDFELVHRHDPTRRCLLEIIGFWTPEYLAEKLRRLRAAGLERVILCVDARRRCSDDDLPEAAKIVRYKRRIDPREVLAMLQELP